MNLSKEKPTSIYLGGVGALVTLLLIFALTADDDGEHGALDLESAGWSSSVLPSSISSLTVPAWGKSQPRARALKIREGNMAVSSGGQVEATEPEVQPAVRFGDRSRGWKFLSSEVRGAIDAVDLHPKAWNAVVVHGGGAGLGDQHDIDHYHRGVLQLPGGMAYHFVLGNGSGSGKGEIEVGRRWSMQHEGPVGAKGEILVCLVGDFDTNPPTPEQLTALDELLSYLRGKLGHIPLHCHEAGAGAGCLGAGFPCEFVKNALN